ncbi:hypothetical protein, partial [Murimonas intestini]
MKKKVLGVCLTLMMVSMLPLSVYAKDAKEDATEAVTEKDGEISMELDYEAEPEAYVGKWVLTNAYTADGGILEVEPKACTLEIELSIDENKLVDEAAYIHA